MNPNHQILFEPVQVGQVTLKNRFAMAPMGPLGLADAEGGFNALPADAAEAIRKVVDQANSL